MTGTDILIFLGLVELLLFLKTRIQIRIRNRIRIQKFKGWIRIRKKFDGTHPRKIKMSIIFPTLFSEFYQTWKNLLIVGLFSLDKGIICSEYYQTRENVLLSLLQSKITY